eukprot:3106724-Rhodomonas_salina.5
MKEWAGSTVVVRPALPQHDHAFVGNCANEPGNGNRAPGWEKEVGLQRDRDDVPRRGGAFCLSSVRPVISQTE